MAQRNRSTFIFFSISLLLLLPSLASARVACGSFHEAYKGAPLLPTAAVFTPVEKDAFLKGLNMSVFQNRYVMLENRNDGHIEFLKMMGVKKSGDSILGDPEVIFKNLDIWVNRLIAERKIEPEQALRAARIYRKDKEYLLLTIDETPPPGFHQDSNFFLTDAQFWAAVASGKFPLGAVTTGFYFSGRNIVSQFVHDMVHLSAYYSNPTLMAAYREAAQMITQTKDPAMLSKLTQRIFVVSELLTAFDDVTRPAVQNYLSSLEITKPMETADVLRSLRGLDQTAVLQSVQEALNLRVKYSYWGGLSRDPLMRYDLNAGVLAETKMFTESLGHRFFNTLDVHHRNFQAYRSPENWNKVLLAQAQLIEFLSHMNGLTPESITKQIVTFDENSPFWKLHCKGSLFQHQHTLVRQKLCN